MTKQKITEVLKTGKILVSDGAWGTFLYQKGLKAGECPDEWSLTHYDAVKDIAQSYIDAGANIAGGCCGTAPQHIKAMKEAVDMYFC